MRNAGRARLVRFGLAGGLIAAIASVAGCATSGAEGAGGPAALFRTQVGHASEAVAPGLRSAWYVQRRPVQYAQVGTASWRSERRPALAAWMERLFGRGRHKPATPVAVAELGSALPAPALVQVTNLATYRTITVRVDDKARLGGAIIRLPPEAAEPLGGTAGAPMQVTLRYLAPVHGYDEPPTLHYALRGAIRRAPGEASPILLAQAAPPAMVLVAERAPAPGQPTLRPMPAVEFTPRLRGELAAPSPALLLQAGAFARRANAERALLRLSPAGRANIVPLRRREETLYRVVLAAPADAAAAEQLRARLARIGFADARLIQPL